MSKIERNAICPCGSTKKYKKCCGKPKARVFTHLSSPELGSKMSGALQSLTSFHSQAPKQLKEEKTLEVKSLAGRVTSSSK